MARSIKKGPYIHFKLLEKVLKANESIKNQSSKHGRARQ
jgi:ribosomal protein S19